jgi:hypothetical protein
MALSVTAAGTMIIELSVIGASGGMSASLGRRSTALGQSHFVAQPAPANTMPAMTAPRMILFQRQRMPSHPSCRPTKAYVSVDRGASETAGFGAALRAD